MDIYIHHDARGESAGDLSVQSNFLTSCQDNLCSAKFDHREFLEAWLGIRLSIQSVANGGGVAWNKP